MINWTTIIITMLGGLAVFLYGMNLMSEGFNKSAGRKIRKLLQSFTRNHISALATGAVATAVVQSSSAVSVMTISLVKAEVLKFPQTFGILLGAGIGTTITAQIIAFKITDYALLIFAAGFFVSIASKTNLLKTSGGAMMGFGLLFFGLHLMSASMAPLRDYAPFLDFLTRLENPAAGIIAGFVFTAIIQSSSAFIGIVIALASQGLIGLEGGVALLLGSNIGTTITCIIASFNAGWEARRVAVAFFMIKLIAVLFVVLWIPSFAGLVKWITSAASSASDVELLPRQIANAHTLFNALATAILLPASNIFSRWIIKMVPQKEIKTEEPVKVEFLDDSLIPTPPLAITVAKKETIRMSNYVREMLDLLLLPFTEKQAGQLHKVLTNEDKVDFLRKKIAIYITKVSQGHLAQPIVQEAFRILYIISEMEQIADIISRDLTKKAEEWLDSEKEFSDAGKQELKAFHAQTVQLFQQTLFVVDTLDARKAAELHIAHRRFRHLVDELKRQHFERLTQNIPESVSTSKMHMEVMSALRAIHSHMGNVVRIIANKE